MNEFSKIITEQSSHLLKGINTIQSKIDYLTGKNTGITDEKEKHVNNICIEFAKKELDKAWGKPEPKKGELKWD